DGQKDLARTFTVEGGKESVHTFSLKVPESLFDAVVKVTAHAAELSDVEVNRLPILPTRFHLTQSRFVSLQGSTEKSMQFEELLQRNDPLRSHERLSIRAEGNLLLGVLDALPYLAEFPYDCVEVILNRYLSAAIVASVFKEAPELKSFAKASAQRKTPLKPWDSNDPNRSMKLEETPWLLNAEGVADSDRGNLKMINVLEAESLRIAESQALTRLQKLQLASGGFPWFPGGPASHFMSLYVLGGFSRALEFGVQVPTGLIERTWDFVLAKLDSEISPCLEKETCLDFLVLLNFVASSFDDHLKSGALKSSHGLAPEMRTKILNFSFGQWRKLPPRLKAYLALTLKRSGRDQDAWTVFSSVLDSAKSSAELGTYWAPEDRSWLWYNDTIESHAFAIRTLLELKPDDGRLAGLVQWLFLNKKLNHWKSTRATAEVLYSLIHYLKSGHKSLVSEEVIAFEVGEQKVSTTLGGKAPVSVFTKFFGPAEIKPEMGKIIVRKKGEGLSFASATWSFSTPTPPTSEQGDFFRVNKSYFRRELKGKEMVLTRLKDGVPLKVGDQIEVQVSISSKHAAEYVHLRDPRPAGFEPEVPTSGFRSQLGLGWYEEIRDSGTNFFFESLPVGEFTMKYRLRATMAGRFVAGPATLQSLYAPEFSAYSAASAVVIAP
ncbi:peptidase inhibitor I39, partial [Planctomyces bekefii]